MKLTYGFFKNILKQVRLGYILITQYVTKSSNFKLHDCSRFDFELVQEENEDDIVISSKEEDEEPVTEEEEEKEHKEDDKENAPYKMPTY